uniref:Uncharacterized protein n=1 Tax=Rhizophora mucronata TaxID=61149 RepID=A0A2P2N6B3_RHIMU
MSRVRNSFHVVVIAWHGMACFLLTGSSGILLMSVLRRKTAQELIS